MACSSLCWGDRESMPDVRTGQQCSWWWLGQERATPPPNLRAKLWFHIPYSRSRPWDLWMVLHVTVLAVAGHWSNCGKGFYDCLDVCGLHIWCKMYIDTFITCDSTERAGPCKFNTKATTHTWTSNQTKPNYKKHHILQRATRWVKYWVEPLFVTKLGLDSFCQPKCFDVVKFWVQGLSMTRSQQLEAVVCVTLATVVIEILVARNGK